MSFRRAALYFAFGIAVYVAWLVATLPAAWVAQRIEHASREVLVLRGTTGSAWAGSGRLYARQRSPRMLDLGLLGWEIVPAKIFSGRVAADIVLGAAANPLRIEWAPGRVELRGLKLELPATILASVAPELEALDPQGNVAIRSDDLRIDERSVLGLAEIEWRGVRLAQAKGLKLGSHIIRLRGGGAKVDIELGSIDGPLRLSGGGTWSPEGGLAISGAVEHDASSPPALVRFLQGMCTEYRNARCAFRFTQ